MILAAAALAAQTPREKGWSVLEAALQAAGGREKLAGVRDMAFELQSRMITPMGEMSFTSRNQLVFPNTVRQDFSMPFGAMTIAFNGTAGWRKGPPGIEKISAEQLRLSLAHLARVNLLFRPPSDPSTVRWDAQDAVNGRACDVIEITSLGDPLRLWVDRANGEVLKRAYRVENSSGGRDEVEEYLSDYREVGGLRLSFQVREMRNSKFARESLTSNMRLNSGLKAADLLQGFQPGP
jgi:hypothetical protein